MPEQHDRKKQHDIDNVKLRTVSLQHLVIKIHQEDRQRDVQHRKHTLPLHETVAPRRRRVDMRRTADRDKAHQNNRDRRNNQRKIHTPKPSLVHSNLPPTKMKISS